jgi:hypothetical protein
MFSGSIERKTPEMLAQIPLPFGTLPDAASTFARSPSLTPVPFSKA